MSAQPSHEEYLPGTTITETEYRSFLRSRGWKEDLPEAEKQRIEQKWAVEDADLAINLGF